jgi:hypothetical protein
MEKGEYAVAQIRVGGTESSIVAWWDGRTGRPSVRTFSYGPDAWLNLNTSKFGLVKRLSAFHALWEAVVYFSNQGAELNDKMAQELAYVEQAPGVQARMDHAILNVLLEPYMAPATETEPEMPSMRLIDIDAEARPYALALVELLNERLNEEAEVAAAERKAGWDTNP